MDKVDELYEALAGPIECVLRSAMRDALINGRGAVRITLVDGELEFEAVDLESKQYSKNSGETK